MFDKEFLEFVESFQSRGGESLAVVYGDGSGSIFVYSQTGPDLNSANCVITKKIYGHHDCTYFWKK